VCELPIDYMSPEHMATLVGKCSKYKTVPMPDFSSIPEGKMGRKDYEGSQAFILASPQQGMTRQISREGTAVVTPRTVDGPSTTKGSAPKPSKQMLETHRKWQEMAELMGGIGARIVVSKHEAKKLIYDELFDSFCPMNITDIYKVQFPPILAIMNFHYSFS
jgi:hypothetical protein